MIYFSAFMCRSSQRLPSTWLTNPGTVSSISAAPTASTARVSWHLGHFGPVSCDIGKTELITIGSDTRHYTHEDSLCITGGFGPFWRIIIQDAHA